jgi:hypothetical protein
MPFEISSERERHNREVRELLKDVEGPRRPYQQRKRFLEKSAKELDRLRDEELHQR